jgi:hypothetical protein
MSRTWHRIVLRLSRCRGPSCLEGSPVTSIAVVRFCRPQERTGGISDPPVDGPSPSRARELSSQAFWIWRGDECRGLDYIPAGRSVLSHTGACTFRWSGTIMLLMQNDWVQLWCWWWWWLLMMGSNTLQSLCQIKWAKGRLRLKTYRPNCIIY